MARKLKSDRVLFIATILLVGLSIVMVYSASAVVALERYQRPYLFLTKQIMWAVLGGAVLGLVMRIDYRHYRHPACIWSCLGVVALGPVAAAMVFAAGLNYTFIAGAALTALPAVAILIMGTAYRRRRMLTFLNPWEDPLGDGFQVIQSLIAVGTGGVWGKGLMNGVQKLFYLPEPHTDFIYSVIAEELGLVGATVVLICFCVITWRGLRVALHAPDSFGGFLALGLTMMVAVQAFVNISVVLGLMPTTGIPLPFVSAGGSSLLTNLLGMGILLNVSQHATPEA